MRRLPAPAKINLALVVGPRRSDGKHEVVTLYQRIDLADRVSLDPAPVLLVTGFRDDSLVHEALRRFAKRCAVEPRWHVRVDKSIPVAAGLGGGSSDAATALRLASETLGDPLDRKDLHGIAAELGADVPFFLEPGPQLGEGDGSRLTAVELPQDYWIVLCLPRGAVKPSTAAVYEAFDRRGGERGFDERRAALLAAVPSISRPADLAQLPANDLASSPIADVILRLGALRADVSGAGPTVFGIFADVQTARRAAGEVRSHGRTWVTVPTWYG